MEVPSLRDMPISVTSLSFGFFNLTAAQQKQLCSKEHLQRHLRELVELLANNEYHRNTQIMNDHLIALCLLNLALQSLPREDFVAHFLFAPWIQWSALRVPDLYTDVPSASAFSSLDSRARYQHSILVLCLRLQLLGATDEIMASVLGAENDELRAAFSAAPRVVDALRIAHGDSSSATPREAGSGVIELLSALWSQAITAADERSSDCFDTLSAMWLQESDFDERNPSSQLNFARLQAYLERTADSLKVDVEALKRNASDPNQRTDQNEAIDWKKLFDSVERAVQEEEFRLSQAGIAFNPAGKVQGVRIASFTKLRADLANADDMVDGLTNSAIVRAWEDARVAIHLLSFRIANAGPLNFLKAAPVDTRTMKTVGGVLLLGALTLLGLPIVPAAGVVTIAFGGLAATATGVYYAATYRKFLARSWERLLEALVNDTDEETAGSGLELAQALEEELLQRWKVESQPFFKRLEPGCLGTAWKIRQTAELLHYARYSKAKTVGIVGPPDAGKSTLIKFGWKVNSVSTGYMEPTKRMGTYFSGSGVTLVDFPGAGDIDGTNTSMLRFSVEASLITVFVLIVTRSAESLKLAARLMQHRIPFLVLFNQVDDLCDRARSDNPTSTAEELVGFVRAKERQMFLTPMQRMLKARAAQPSPIVHANLPLLITAVRPDPSKIQRLRSADWATLVTKLCVFSGEEVADFVEDLLYRLCSPNKRAASP